MKDTITLQNRVYETREVIADKFGVAAKTIGRRARCGVLPRPLRIGRTKYYDAAEVEACLAESSESRE